MNLGDAEDQLANGDTIEMYTCYGEDLCLVVKIVAGGKGETGGIEETGDAVEVAEVVEAVPAVDTVDVGDDVDAVEVVYTEDIVELWASLTPGSDLPITVNCDLF